MYRYSEEYLNEREAWLKIYINRMQNPGTFLEKSTTVEERARWIHNSKTKLNQVVQWQHQHQNI